MSVGFARGFCALLAEMGEHVFLGSQRKERGVSKVALAGWASHDVGSHGWWNDGFFTVGEAGQHDVTRVAVLGVEQVFGQLEKGHSVRNLTVMGGSCDVYGRVDGDVSVMGGRVTLHEGAIVEHDVTTMGGHVEIERGATVRGRYATLGGSIHREDGSVVSGRVEGPHVSDTSHRSEKPKSFFQRVGDAVSNTAILFVLGVVFLAIAPKRMEMLRVEVARAPMRQVGLGIIGFFGFLLAVVVLCVTVIGIPVALIAVFLGLVGLYGGMVAGLTVIGAALVRHKSENPYVHLAVGCFVFFVVYPLPFIGPPLTFALLLLGVGVLVSTRFAGFLPTKKKVSTVDVRSENPYR